jgi:diguanylate cyclase (GGDEF)-like protein/PAS domain S-box-containing protein
MNAVDHVRLEEELREGRNLFEGAFEDAAIGMALLAFDGRWLEVNRSFCEVLGYTLEELLELSFEEITHPEDLATDLGQVGRLLADELRYYQVEKRYFHKEGHTIWVMLSVSLVRDGEGNPRYFIVQLQDTSERKRLEARLSRMAYHDLLTGLPNRALFQEHFEQAVHRADRDGSNLAILYLDLQGFKAVNDAWGHETGDKLLIATANRLRSYSRFEDTVARFGGDEFCILVERIGGAEDAVRVARRVGESISEPFSVYGRRVSVTASIGIALRSPGQNLSADQLLREADAAMYQAKRKGRVRFELFEAVHDSGDSAVG